MREGDFTRGYRNYALLIIFFANFLNYLDRLMVSAVLPDIIENFRISGFKANLLWSAFTIGYMVTAPFVGYIADKARRTTIFAICIFVWSFATIGTGLARSYSFLLLMRVITGAGEAGCLIIGPALLSDYFPKQVRGKVLGIFYLGLPLGSVGGFIVGGALGWPNSFFAGGIPGIIVSLFILMLLEPKRTEPFEIRYHAISPTSIKDYLFLLRSKTLLFIILAQAIAIFSFIPIVHNAVTFMERERGIRKEEAAILIGIIAGLSGLLGSVGGGLIGDRLYKKTRAAYSIVASLSMFFGFPFLLTAILSPLKILYLPAIGFTLLFFFMFMPSVNTQIANITSAKERAKAFALAVFAVHLFGDTFSPPIFGFLSDRFESLKLAFLLFTFPIILSGFIALCAALIEGKRFLRVVRT
jgi:MFS family permease